ncbi:serine/threonine-protein kinase [Microbacterium sp. 10M-3C3]|uniref:serine/threonine-protein kinase n=1 Tax=Microbacterium sp. 10M-3C3 TaxID=2483401 RepID=UPI000F62DD6A|nr:serine/threonine-protein kinase [Microbacterium sp. 10M-3C3]
MSRRAPQSPPELPGFTYLELLGSGGFADVFLYEQHLPKRRVAVKVLLTDRMSSGSVAAFTAEANVMAMLSTHPAIVTIHQAGVAGDGRPYLVMEYCSKPNLQARYRREPFSVAEALRVGVQVAAAVETAHRAGVLHRDIKPANILVTEYNRPALTDFGIASTTGAGDAGGLSIPWSPPEALAAVPTGDRRSDVWSLGATVYSLLAGRSPFELSGQRNSGAELLERIEKLPLPPLGRPDAPPSLQRVLERAMAKAPADRYDTALAFARALQKVQIELAHGVTPIDILDDGTPDGVVDDEDDGLTRVRGVVSIDPETAPAAGATRPAASAAASAAAWGPTTATGGGADADATHFRGPSVISPGLDDTVVAARPPARGASAATPAAAPAPAVAATPAAAPAPAVAAPPLPPVPAGVPVPGGPAAVGPTDPGATPRGSRRALWLTAGAAAFVVVIAVILALALPAVLGGGATPEPTAAPSDQPVDVLPQAAPRPTDLAGTVTPGGVVFTWTNPDPADGDTYLWGVAVPGGEPSLESVTETTVTVPADSSGRTCIEVLTRRANGQASQPATACAP